MRRLTSVVAGLVLAALWVTPAYAMSSPVFKQGPAGGSTVPRSVQLQVESTAETLLVIGLEKVFIEVTVSGPGAPGSLGKREGETYSATWNVDPDYNGTYEIRATASSSNANSPSKSTTITGLKVNNPPATPSSVKATLKDSGVAVTWAANPEKDITGYRVLRSVDGGSYSQVASGAATSYTDTSAPHSKSLSYKVMAVRKSPLGDGTIESTSGATPAVTIPPPPEPAPGAAQGAAQGAADPNKPTVPGTNIVTGKESPKPAVPLNNSFGKAIAPIVKSAPAGTAFDETLPYSGTPPEQFEAASGGDPAPLDTGDSEGVSVTNPLKFIVGGLLLAVASFFMWRKSRELLKGTRPQDQLAPTRVNFPTFRINRG